MEFLRLLQEILTTIVTDYSITEISVMFSTLFCVQSVTKSVHCLTKQAVVNLLLISYTQAELET